MATHFLYLANTTLVSLVARRGRIAERRTFEASDAGAGELEAYLRAGLRNTPTHLITDVAEEDFRADTIPHVGGRDQEAISARRLAQIFRNTPYRHAFIQGREAEGRRDDRVIYAAITNPDVARPWIALLERLEVPLAGMHSAALLGTRVVQALALEHEHLLLVMLSPGNALRQTYFRKGELRFTRLIPIDLAEGQTLGSVIAEETTRTWQYLENLRSFAAEDRLDAAIVAHPRDVDGIRAELQRFDRFGYAIIDTDQAAARVRMTPPPRESTAEELLVHLLVRSPPRNHFASSEMRRFWTLRAARRALTTASFGVLAIGLVVGMLNLVRIAATSEADRNAEREARRVNQTYDEIARSLPTQQVGGATMRDAVAFYSGFVKDYPSLASFVIPLSAALEGHPAVRVSQIAWQATDDAKAVPGMTLQLPRNPPPVKALASKGGDAGVRSAVDESAAPPFAGGRHEVALLEATVTVPSHDFRSALAVAESLAADIGRIRGFRAEIVESPLDIRPSLALQGRHAEREQGAMEARFVLRIVRSRAAAA